MKVRFVLIITFLSCLSAWAGESSLEPNMVQLDELVLSEDFTVARPLDIDDWEDMVRRFKPTAHKILKPEKA